MVFFTLNYEGEDYIMEIGWLVQLHIWPKRNLLLSHLLGEENLSHRHFLGRLPRIPKDP